MTPERVIDDARGMVIEDEPLEANSLQRQHDLDRIVVPFAEKALLKPGHTPLHVPEVDVDDAVQRAKVLDGFDDVGSGFGPRAEAEIETVVAAGGNLEGSGQSLVIPEEAG